ncbi:hypothetical protein [Colwellia sp. UCD-KL20]|uniref:hypothetical protein n=1 Tax=Colwellia sp. UCD-KL20 TaxID=1917165 RepID=UPI000970788E|nr:hypothetical protein [Colwellia sp. UCD-KL20]
MKANKFLLYFVVLIISLILMSYTFILFYKNEGCINVIDNFDKIGTKKFTDFKYFNLQKETNNNWASYVSLENNNLTFGFHRGEGDIQPFGNKVERIQTNLYSFIKRPKWIQNTFMFELSEDMLPVINTNSEFKWLTIFEVWNDPGWIGSSSPYRLSFNLIKDSELDYLTPVLSGEYKDYEKNTWKTLWKDKLNTKIIPGIKYEFLIALDLLNSPSVSVELTDLSHNTTTKLDVDRALQHPNLNEVKGFWGLNPIKLYTGSRVLDEVTKHNGALAINFSNVKVCYKNINLF